MERIRLETLWHLQASSSQTNDCKKKLALDLPPSYEDPPTYEEARKIKKFYSFHHIVQNANILKGKH